MDHADLGAAVEEVLRHPRELGDAWYVGPDFDPNPDTDTPS
ncbi:hypothetical protein [Streptomyces sp. NPDC059009]